MHPYVPKLCTPIYRSYAVLFTKSCVFLFTDFCALLFTDHKNRHLEGSLEKFRLFIGKSRILSLEITENLCTRFRTYLLDRLNGKSPSDYFGAFKRVIKSATKEGYFRINPAEDLKRKTNPCKKIKEFLEADEYIKLVQTPIINTEIRDAFIYS